MTEKKLKKERPLDRLRRRKVVYWSGDIEHKLYNQTTYSKLPFLYLVILISSKILVMFNKITMVLRTYLEIAFSEISWHV